MSLIQTTYALNDDLLSLFGLSLPQLGCWCVELLSVQIYQTFIFAQVVCSIKSSRARRNRRILTSLCPVKFAVSQNFAVKPAHGVIPYSEPYKSCGQTEL